MQQKGSLHHVTSLFVNHGKHHYMLTKLTHRFLPRKTPFSTLQTAVFLFENRRFINTNSSF